MSKFLDSINNRKISVDVSPEFEKAVSSEPPENLKTCLICNMPFIKSRAKYCSRKHYIDCLYCGGKVAILPSHINGVAPKTCSKACADALGVQTYKENCIQKYGVSNPMFVPELVKDMIAKRNPDFDFSLKEEEQIRNCEVCGKDFKFDYLHPRKCCSDACSALLRKSSISSVVKICKLCGKPFTSDSNNSLYCEGPHYRNCIICGKKFQIRSTDSSSKTCSEACKEAAYRRTCMKRYGVEIGSQSAQAREKLSIAGRRNNPKQLKKEPPKPETIKSCTICGEPFVITSNAQLICNKQHYRACDVCGKLYPCNNSCEDDV